MAHRRPKEHLYIETDGQVYLVRDRGQYRFPHAGERLSFRTEPNGVMDFGGDHILRRKCRRARAC